jgi:transmembrane sensor
MSTNDSGTDIREQAAHWVVRMTESPDSLGAAELDEFQTWLLADERHQYEFRIIGSIPTMTADLPSADRARLSDWAAEHAVDRTSSRRQFFRRSAIAASVLTVALLGGYFVKSQGWLADSYATRTGETRVVTFSEGSVAYLNTRTEVRWVGSDRDRRVALIEGEALFDVVHDEARPFRVMLDHSEIRVLGTRFNVYRKPSGETIITVLEGTVEVRGYGAGSGRSEWARTLRTNQQIEYRPIGLMHEPHETVALNAVKWRQGVLKFEDEPIPNVLDELTRYTDQRILIRDPRLAELRIGGALNTRNVRGALARLEELAPIEVKESSGTFILDYRPDASQKQKD